MAAVCTHADNYPRKDPDGKTPYALAAKLIPRRLLDELGISGLRADEVVLRPGLLPGRQG